MVIEWLSDHSHAGVAHLLLEADAQKVEAARAAGAPVFHADASRPFSLFSYQGSCRSCDSHIRLSHLFELVKNFFCFFETFF